jgi:hypothetical protein
LVVFSAILKKIEIGGDGRYGGEMTRSPRNSMVSRRLYFCGKFRFHLHILHPPFLAILEKIENGGDGVLASDFLYSIASYRISDSIIPSPPFSIFFKHLLFINL